MLRLAAAIAVCLCLAATNSRPVHAAGAAGELSVTGRDRAELKPLDDAMRELLGEHETPGAALAVTHRGRLVYARGFGFADVDEKQPVEPTSRFRIASISKPITAVAIMRLVEQERLRLDDKVYSVLKIDLPTDGELKADPRLADVTIRHCLQHTGGWDRDKSFDPMFRSVIFAQALKVPPPAKAADVIQYMVRVPLDFVPSERYAYSNFGYCLLGRVIEQLTGQTYEEYVRAEVLKPLGIVDMQIGKTLLLGRADGEVRYYDQAQGSAVLGDQLGQQVPSSYGAWYLEAMDSHGGWIASAPDLVRFAASLDTTDRCPILKPASIEAMFARPTGLPGYDEQGQPKPAYYACGWNVRPVDGGGRNTWHGGSLPGTSTWLVRRHDGLNWAVLFNRRDGRGGQRMSAHADRRINEVLSGIEKWPDHDLFDQR